MTYSMSQLLGRRENISSIRRFTVFLFSCLYLSLCLTLYECLSVSVFILDLHVFFVSKSVRFLTVSVCACLCLPVLLSKHAFFVGGSSCTCLFRSISSCVCLCLPVSVCKCLWLAVSVFICLPVSLSDCLSVCLLSFCLSDSLSVCLISSLFPPVCLSSFLLSVRFSLCLPD